MDSLNEPKGSILLSEAMLSEAMRGGTRVNKVIFVAIQINTISNMYLS